VRVEGQLVFSSVFQALDAALAGLGIGYVPEDLAEPYLARGRLERALEDWSAPWSGYHLYYPTAANLRRRSPSLSMRCVTEAPGPHA
jgi:DNA-binding transcriptional LysR family regulator